MKVFLVSLHSNTFDEENFVFATKKEAFEKFYELVK